MMFAVSHERRSRTAPAPLEVRSGAAMAWAATLGRRSTALGRRSGADALATFGGTACATLVLMNASLATVGRRVGDALAALRCARALVGRRFCIACALGPCSRSGAARAPPLPHAPEGACIGIVIMIRFYTSTEDEGTLLAARNCAVSEASRFE